MCVCVCVCVCVYSTLFRIFVIFHFINVCVYIRADSTDFFSPWYIFTYFQDKIYTNPTFNSEKNKCSHYYKIPNLCQSFNWKLACRKDPSYDCKLL